MVGGDGVVRVVVMEITPTVADVYRIGEHHNSARWRRERMVVGRWWERWSEKTRRRRWMRMDAVRGVMRSGVCDANDVANDCKSRVRHEARPCSGCCVAPRKWRSE